MVDIDKSESYKSVDKDDMIGKITGFSSQCKQGIEIGKNFNLGDYFKDINKVVFTGMGGSAIGADILTAYLRDEMKLPVFVNRNYTLPGFIDRQTAVFTCSYSGNTEEVLSAYNEAKNKKARIFSITSGGELKKRADSDGFPYITIPGGYPPRAAFGYSFFPLFTTVIKAGWVSNKDEELNEVPKLIKELCEKQIGPEINRDSNIAKNISEFLHEHIGIVYGAEGYMGIVAFRWKGQICENSKNLAYNNVIPEMNHNEIMGWQFPEK
jgi:glucose/mannose-6-phosphate isomerase